MVLVRCGTEKFSYCANIVFVIVKYVRECVSYTTDTYQTTLSLANEDIEYLYTFWLTARFKLPIYLKAHLLFSCCCCCCATTITLYTPAHHYQPLMLRFAKATHQLCLYLPEIRICDGPQFERRQRKRTTSHHHTVESSWGEHMHKSTFIQRYATRTRHHIWICW